MHDLTAWRGVLFTVKLPERHGMGLQSYAAFHRSESAGRFATTADSGGSCFIGKVAARSSSSM